MASWTNVGKDSPPVVGNPSEFDALAQTFARMSGRVRQLNYDFLLIGKGQSSEFSGEAAQAFGQQLDDISTKVKLVPDIADQIKSILHEHGQYLEDLKREADSALARAESHWNKKQRAQDDVNYHESRLSSIDHQIECLGGRDLDFSADLGISDFQRSQRLELINRRSSIEYDLARSKSDIRQAENGLDDSRHDWASLHEREEELNKNTSRRLKNVELSDLADPSGLGQMYEGIKDYMKVIWEHVVKAAEYLSSDEFLSALHQFLGYMIEALDIVCIALTILAFIPGLQVLGAVAATLAVITAVYAGMGALIGAIRFARGDISEREFIGDLGQFTLSLIPYAPSMGMLKTAGRAVSKLSRGVSRVARSNADALEDVGYSVNKLGDAIADKIRHGTEEASGVLRRQSDSLTGAVREVVDFGKRRVALGVEVVGGIDAHAIDYAGDIAMAGSRTGASLLRGVDKVQATTSRIFVSGLDHIAHSKASADKFLERTIETYHDGVDWMLDYSEPEPVGPVDGLPSSPEPYRAPLQCREGQQSVVGSLREATGDVAGKVLGGAADLLDIRSDR